MPTITCVHYTYLYLWNRLNCSHTHTTVSNTVFGPTLTFESCSVLLTAHTRRGNENCSVFVCVNGSPQENTLHPMIVKDISLLTCQTLTLSNLELTMLYWKVHVCEWQCFTTEQHLQTIDSYRCLPQVTW